MRYTFTSIYGLINGPNSETEAHERNLVLTLFQELQRTQAESLASNDDNTFSSGKLCIDEQSKRIVFVLKGS